MRWIGTHTGQHELQCLWEKYYREVHAIVYVVDATDHSRLRESKNAFDTMVVYV